jgi:outer membrane protein assembly factor BamB
MPSRRAVLAAGGLALTSGLAGCSAAPPPPESTFDTPTTAWPMAGYDPAGTGNPPAGPSEPTVAWRRSRGSLDPPLYGILSTPVVADGTVYVAGLTTRFYDPDDMTSVLAALDAETGDLRWQHNTPPGLTGGPAVVGDPPAVVAGGRDGTLHAMDPQGESRWTVDLRGELGTPTAYGDRVYVASSTGRLHAVDADGTRGWTADRPGPLEIVLGPDDPIETTMPVAEERGVYAAFTPFDRKRDETVLLAYGHDGSRRWRTTLPGRYGRAPGGLAVTENALYVTVGGTVYAVAPEDGTQRWQFVSGADTAGPPTTDGERVYVGAKNLYALDAADGTEQWRVVNEAPADDDDVRDPQQLPYLARPPVADGQVYLRTGAFDTADGSRRWGDDADAWLTEGNYFTDYYYRRPMARPVVTSEAVVLTHPHHGVMTFR